MEESGFIYAVTREARDGLLRAGYDLLHEDQDNGMWVFANKAGSAAELRFGLGALHKDCVFSDTLSF